MIVAISHGINYYFSFSLDCYAILLLLNRIAGMECSSYLFLLLLSVIFNRYSGKSKVCCLYPNKNATSKTVQDAFSSELSTELECTQPMVHIF